MAIESSDGVGGATKPGARARRRRRSMGDSSRPPAHPPTPPHNKLLREADRLSRVRCALARSASLRLRRLSVAGVCMPCCDCDEAAAAVKGLAAAEAEPGTVRLGVPSARRPGVVVRVVFCEGVRACRDAAAAYLAEGVMELDCN